MATKVLMTKFLEFLKLIKKKLTGIELLAALIYFIFTVHNLSYASARNEGLKPQLQGDGRFGMPGCGFGSMVYEPREYPLFSMILNHITSSQALGISSGTSNCHDPDPAVALQATSLPEFIEVNKNKISQDAARGSGETIKALSEILQCNPKEVGLVLKENYKKIFIDTEMQSAAIEAKINNYIMDDQKCF